MAMRKGRDLIKLLHASAAALLLVMPQGCRTPAAPSSDPYAGERQQLDLWARQLDTLHWQDAERKLHLTEHAITLSEDIGDSNHLALFLYLKGHFLFRLERYDSLVFYADSAARLSQEIGDRKMEARARSIVAGYYLFTTGDYFDSFLQYQKIIDLCRQIHFKRGLATANNALGMLYYELSDPAKALTYFENAYRFFSEDGDRRNAALVRINIGNCYSSLNRLSEALSAHNEALEQFRSIGDSLQIAGEYVNLGRVYFSRKQYPEALRYLHLAQEYPRAASPSLAGITLETLGSVYLESGDIPRAREFLTESLQLMRSIGRRAGEAEVLRLLATVSEQEGDYSAAYRAYKISREIDEETQGAEVQKKIAEAKALSDIRQQEYEKQLLLNKVQLKSRQNVILILSLLSSLIILALFVELLRLKNRDMRKNARLAELEKMEHRLQLEERNKELVTSSLQLAIKNDVLGEIAGLSDKLSSGPEMNVRALRGALTSILDQDYGADSDWTYFKNMFEQVHIGFFDAVKRCAPSLTDTELRICAYIKINLQNKEIARIMHVNPESVLKSRYRIRKKLGLRKPDSLEDFIRTLDADSLDPACGFDR